MLREYILHNYVQVESVQFVGQKHTWRLNQVLQKGSQQSTLTLRRDLARALHLLGTSWNAWRCPWKKIWIFL